MKLKILFLPLLIIVAISCDQGIEPKESLPAGFSGVITFVGEWPNDIQRTHIVMFKDPLLSANDFSSANLKYVSQEIPNNSETFSYNSMESAVIPSDGILDAGEYSYLAVAQSKTPNLSLNRADWYIAGLYFTLGDSTRPGKIILTEGETLENVNITCDFDNPPPQPPGGD